MKRAAFPCRGGLVQSGWYWPVGDEDYVAPVAGVVPLLAYNDEFPTRRVLVGWYRDGGAE